MSVSPFLRRNVLKRNVVQTQAKIRKELKVQKANKCLT